MSGTATGSARLSVDSRAETQPRHYSTSNEIRGTRGPPRLRSRGDTIPAPLRRARLWRAYCYTAPPQRKQNFRTAPYSGPTIHPQSATRRLFRDNRRVVLQRSRRCREVSARTEHDLIDRDAILALLQADGLRPGGPEIDRRGRTGARPVVLPSPAADAGAVRILQGDDGGL